MRNLLSYCLFIVVVIVFASCGQDKEELPSLRETYSYKDELPFGTQVMYNQLNQYFYHNEVKVKKTNLQKTLSGNYDTTSLYVNVSKNFFLSKDEMNSLLSFVSNGNTAFISSDEMDTAFLNELDVHKITNGSSVQLLINSLNYTTLKLVPAIFNDSTDYSFYFLPFNNVFNKYPGEKVKVLGTNQSGEADFIVLFYGKGRFYLHCEPRGFSNYFLLQKKNYEYLQQAFSFIPAIPEHIYWDDFYNKRNTAPSEKEAKSGLAVLLQYPPMAWAFGLVVALLLLFILFDGKRRQRIVKPLQPTSNTSVAFTETVSRLYLQKKDNRNIADKMITYFFEHLRNQYFLNAAQLDDAFKDTLSRKTNVSRQDVDKLFGNITSIQHSAQISDQELLSLNQQIENFFKHKT